MKNISKAAFLLCGLSSISPAGFANGFIDDAKFDLSNRNFYFYRDFRNGGSNAAGGNAYLPVSEREGYRSEWAHGLIGQLNSGYTEGPVQFAVNAYTLIGLKLYSDDLKTGNNLLKIDERGNADDAYAEIGGSVKLKVNQTEFTYGNQFPNVPVLSMNLVRLLPSTATGLSLQDKSFEHLTLNAGYFYRMNPVDSTKNLNYFTTDYAAGIEADSTSYLGGSYQFKQGSITGYVSELEDVWNQYYLGGQYVYSLPFENQKLKFNTANYWNKDSGQSKGGEIDAAALSGMLGYQLGPQTFSLAYQQIVGDEPFDWIGFKTMGGSVAILNALQFATFSEAKEKSLQFKYEADLSNLGIPGLSFMGRYTYGWDFDNSKSQNAMYTKRFVYDPSLDNKHWERDLQIGYKVQSGFAKDVDIKLRQATHRGTEGYRYADIDELRIIIDFPIRF